MSGDIERKDFWAFGEAPALLDNYLDRNITPEDQKILEGLMQAKPNIRHVISFTRALAEEINTMRMAGLLEKAIKFIEDTSPTYYVYGEREKTRGALFWRKTEITREVYRVVWSSEERAAAHQAETKWALQELHSYYQRPTANSRFMEPHIKIMLEDLDRIYYLRR